MKYLNPVIIGVVPMLAAAAIALANADNLLRGHSWLIPYLYSACAVLIIFAVINAFSISRQESKPTAAELKEAKHKQFTLKYSDLMVEETELRKRLVSAQDNIEFHEILSERDGWVGKTVALLKEAERYTDAVAFAQIGNLAPTTKYIEEFRHVQDWKRAELGKLAMYREKLDQIADVR